MLLLRCSWFKYSFIKLDLVTVVKFCFHFILVLGSVVGCAVGLPKQRQVHCFGRPLCSLTTSICNFVPCDRVLQKAYKKNEYFAIVSFCHLLRDLAGKTATFFVGSGFLYGRVRNDNRNKGKLFIIFISLFTLFLLSKIACSL